MGTVIDMGNMIYVSGADHRATAERHFRKAEDKMLSHFEGLEKGYTADVKGWKLTLECGRDRQEIDLRYTCQWEVENFDDLNISVIRFKLDGKPHELIFSTPILFDTDKVLFIGMRYTT